MSVPSIEVAITRQDPDDAKGSVGNTDNSIDLATAIEAYTRNAAWVMHQEDKVGTIEVGKRHDTCRETDFQASAADRRKLVCQDFQVRAVTIYAIPLSISQFAQDIALLQQFDCFASRRFGGVQETGHQWCRNHGVFGQ